MDAGSLLERLADVQLALGSYGLGPFVAVGMVLAASAALRLVGWVVAVVINERSPLVDLMVGGAVFGLLFGLVVGGPVSELGVRLRALKAFLAE